MHERRRNLRLGTSMRQNQGDFGKGLAKRQEVVCRAHCILARMDHDAKLPLAGKREQMPQASAGRRPLFGNPMDFQPDYLIVKIAGEVGRTSQHGVGDPKQRISMALREFMHGNAFVAKNGGIIRKHRAGAGIDAMRNASGSQSAQNGRWRMVSLTVLSYVDMDIKQYGLAKRLHGAWNVAGKGLLMERTDT